MAKLEIEMNVLKMSIGRTDKDETQESSGLRTQLAFAVKGSPRSLARMANLLKQGNVDINLIVVATNAATDLKIESFDLDHQMKLGEAPKNLSPAASQPPVANATEHQQTIDQSINVLMVGNTPIRTGEPLVNSIPSGVPDTDKPIVTPGICVNCGYTASESEISSMADTAKICPACGKNMEIVGVLSSNTVTMGSSPDDQFEDLGAQRDALAAMEPPAPAPEKTKRTRRKREPANIT